MIFSFTCYWTLFKYVYFSFLQCTIYTGVQGGCLTFTPLDGYLNLQEFSGLILPLMYIVWGKFEQRTLKYICPDMSKGNGLLQSLLYTMLSIWDENWSIKSFSYIMHLLLILNGWLCRDLILMWTMCLFVLSNPFTDHQAGFRDWSADPMSNCHRSYGCCSRQIKSNQNLFIVR